MLLLVLLFLSAWTSLDCLRVLSRRSELACCYTRDSRAQTGHIINKKNATHFFFPFFFHSALLSLPLPLLSDTLHTLPPLPSSPRPATQRQPLYKPYTTSFPLQLSLSRSSCRHSQLHRAIRDQIFFLLLHNPIHLLSLQPFTPIQTTTKDKMCNCTLKPSTHSQHPPLP